MSDILIRGIKCLYQFGENSGLKRIDSGIQELPMLENAFLLIKEGRIEDYGPMADCPEINIETIDLKNASDVIPCFVDSHTHTVHAATREEEFEQKLRGLSYAEIAASGGGILNSARRLNEMSEDALFDRSSRLVNRIISSGTGALEIKSGYGLSLAGELKMLRVIKRLKEHHDIPIKATFLGAHALPIEYKKDKAGYMNLIEKEMLPNIAKENLADYIDVFCEKGFFDIEDTRRVIEWGEKYGLRAKIHSNQFNSIGGVELAVEKGMLSIDHLETISETEMNLLAKADVLSVFLPGAAFFLNMDFPTGRKAIDAGMPVVLASDFNPGSSPSYSMELVQSMACVKMRMLPVEAFHASTINAAYALELEGELGSITKGKLGNVAILKKHKNYKHISYEFGSETVDQVIIKGKAIL